MTFQDILSSILPKASGGVYNQDGVQSAGGSLQLPGLPQVGGTIGMDQGVPFGNANVNHQQVANFGPFPVTDARKGVNLDTLLQTILGIH